MIIVDVLTNGWTIAGVIASFCVALVAVISIIISNRKANELNKKEVNRNGIREIINWLFDILNFISPASKLDTITLIKLLESDIDPVTVSKADSYFRQNELLVIASKAVYINSLADQFLQGDTSTIDLVTKELKLVDQHLRVLKLMATGKTTHPDESYKKHRERLLDSTNELIECLVRFLSNI